MPAPEITSGNMSAGQPAATSASLDAPTSSAAHVASPNDPKRSEPMPATSPTAPTRGLARVSGGLGEQSLLAASTLLGRYKVRARLRRHRCRRRCRRWCPGCAGRPRAGPRPPCRRGRHRRPPPWCRCRRRRGRTSRWPSRRGRSLAVPRGGKEGLQRWRRPEAGSRGRDEFPEVRRRRAGVQGSKGADDEAGVAGALSQQRPGGALRAAAAPATASMRRAAPSGFV